MADLKITTSQLDSAFKTLRQRLEETKALWNDPVRRRFEKEHWAPLENQTRATLKEMERLAQVIAQARRSVR